VSKKPLGQTVPSPHVTPFESMPRSQWVGETANTFAFNDINHNAPVHILIVPKKRINTALDAPPEVVAEMVGLAVELAREHHMDQSGFRLVIRGRRRFIIYICTCLVGVRCVLTISARQGGRDQGISSPQASF
jgi:hypothetical protein